MTLAAVEVEKSWVKMEEKVVEEDYLVMGDFLVTEVGGCLETEEEDFLGVMEAEEAMEEAMAVVVMEVAAVVVVGVEDRAGTNG